MIFIILGVLITGLMIFYEFEFLRHQIERLEDQVSKLEFRLTELESFRQTTAPYSSRPIEMIDGQSISGSELFLPQDDRTPIYQSGGPVDIGRLRCHIVPVSDQREDS